MNTTASITARLEFSQVDTNISGTRSTSVGGINLVTSLASGTGAGQIDTQWNSSRILTSGEIINYDLTSMQKEVLGGTFAISFENGFIKGFCLENLSTGVTDFINISFSGANGFSNLLGSTGTNITVGPESSFLWFDKRTGQQVTSSNKDFQINDVNSMGCEYSLVIVGVTGL